MNERFREAYFDGAAKGNPGPAGCAYVLVENGQVVRQGSKHYECATNNEMEWRAALAAVRMARHLGWTKFQLVGDSQLVVNQIKGEYKVKEQAFKALKQQMDKLLQGLDVEVVWVPREQNELANDLAQAAADRDGDPDAAGPSSDTLSVVGSDVAGANRRPRRVRVIGNYQNARVPDGAVYIGRKSPTLSASPFANPFRQTDIDPATGQPIGKAEAIRRYREWLLSQPELVERAKRELAGRDLACWCKEGEPCHGDVLLEVLYGPPQREPDPDAEPPKGAPAPMCLMIGTTDPTQEQEQACRAMAERAAQSGIVVLSGGADGIDTISVTSAHAAGGQVVSILPWARPHRLPGIVEVQPPVDAQTRKAVVENHPNPSALKESYIKLHARNWRMVQRLRSVIEQRRQAGLDVRDCIIIALPDFKDGEPWGGTTMGMRLSRVYGIPCLYYIPGTGWRWWNPPAEGAYPTFFDGPTAPRSAENSTTQEAVKHRVFVYGRHPLGAGYPAEVSPAGYISRSVENGYYVARAWFWAERHEQDKERVLRKIGWLSELEPEIVREQAQLLLADAGWSLEDSWAWEEIRVPVMWDLLLQKFEDDRLRRLLLETGEAELLVHTPGDTYWGVCQGCTENGCVHGGYNMLGRLLMQLRDQLRSGRKLEEVQMEDIIPSYEPPRPTCMIVGSHEPTAAQVEVAQQAGRAAARRGVTVLSGGASGVDEAAVRAAAAAGGFTITVLPWSQKHDLPGEVVVQPDVDAATAQKVREHHPNPSALKESHIRLHARNWRMVQHLLRVIRARQAVGADVGDCIVFAIPRLDASGEPTGGTAMAMKFARSVGIPVKYYVPGQGWRWWYRPDDEPPTSGGGKPPETPGPASPETPPGSVDIESRASNPVGAKQPDGVSVSGVGSVRNDAQTVPTHTAGVEEETMEHLKIDAHTGVFAAGMGFVLRGAMAGAVSAGKVFVVDLPGVRGVRFDPKQVRVMARVEDGTLVVEAPATSAEAVILSYMSAVNADRAVLMGYAHAVPVDVAKLGMANELGKVIKDLRRNDLRKADAPMIGALGTVHAQVSNGQCVVGVGERLLADLARMAGITGTVRKRALKAAKLINKMGVPAMVFRNPVTEATNSAVSVKVVVVPDSHAIFLPPELAKRFYGDFDGDLYFLLVAIAALQAAGDADVSDEEERELLRRNRLIQFALKPDPRVSVRHIGTKTLPVSVFNGILPVIGAEVRTVTGAYHAVAVAGMDIVGRLLGPVAAIRFGDLLLPLIEVIMDAGKETSKVDRVKHGLPFAEHIVGMLQLSSAGKLAPALYELAVKVGEYFGNPECPEAVAIREAADIMAEAATTRGSEVPGMMERLEGSGCNFTLPYPGVMADLLLGRRYDAPGINLAQATERTSAGAEPTDEEIYDALYLELGRRISRLPAAWDRPDSLKTVPVVTRPVQLRTVNRHGVERVVDVNGLDTAAKRYLVEWRQLRHSPDGIVRLPLTAVSSGTEPMRMDDTPPFLVYMESRDGWHQFVVLVPVIHSEPTSTGRNLVTAYRPVVRSPRFRPLKRLGGHLMSIQLDLDGTVNTLGGRFALGKVGDRFGIVFQPAHVVLLETVLIGIARSQSVTVQRGKMRSVWAQLLPMLQRDVDRAVHAVLDETTVNPSPEGLDYLSHQINVDEELLSIIRRPIRGWVKTTLPNGRVVLVKRELPRLDEVSYTEIGVRMDQLLAVDGNPRRIFLPLKKDGSRLFWFDPSSEKDLREMGIAVADTNFRRAVREQLPLEKVDILDERAQNNVIELVVAFANGPSLVTPKGESVEGGFLATDVPIRVTRTVQVEIDPSGGAVGAQLWRRAAQDRLRPTHILSPEGWVEFDAKQFVMADTDQLEKMGVRIDTEELLDGVTLTRASVKFGFEGTPDACKVMVLDGTIKGVVSRLDQQSLVAKIGNNYMPVDMVLPASAIVEKKTGSMVFYGLCRLFGYLDLIEQYDEALLAQRAARQTKLADGDDGQAEDQALLARFRDLLIERLQREHPNVDVDRVPILAVTFNKDGEPLATDHIGEAMVLKVRVVFLPHTSATIGRFDKFGSQMLLRAALWYRAQAGDEVAKAILPAACATKRNGEPDVEYAQRMASRIESVLVLYDKLSGGEPLDLDEDDYDDW